MGKEHRRVVGKKQKKKHRNVKIVQRAGASKHGPIAASPGTMSPVPLVSTGDDSTTLPQKADGTTCCPHVEQAVQLEKLRTQFRTKPLPQCASCPSSRPSRSRAGAKEDLWICLSCGQLGCGWHKHDAKNGSHWNPKFLHASGHRHDLQHPIVMHWSESFDCWCLECDTLLMYPADEATSTKPRLLQKAAALLQESIYGHSSSVVKGESPGHVETGHVEEDDASKGAPSRPLASRRVVKGLMNLGNTCFFNSVMQNLVGVSMLREHFSKEASEPEGVLKTSLRDFFQEMDPTPDEADGEPGRSMRTRSFGGSLGSVVSPRGLFSAICTKAPRFKGFQQQDSHELLRCLLDGLHVEEESRRKSTAESNGSEGSPKKVPDTFVEHMFGGQLSSTVTCCECRHSSVVYEAFLDLSLPIPSKQERAKVESIREQFPKSIPQRSQRGNAYGVLSVETARLDSGLVDITDATAMEDLKKARDAPALRCNLGPLSVLDGAAAAANSEALNDSEEKQLGSMTGCDKVLVGQGFEKLPATTLPCESISVGAAACSWENDTDQGWLNYVDESPLGKSGESAAMSFLDQRVDSDTTASAPPGFNPPQEVEIGRVSFNQGEEMVGNSPEDTFSLQGGGTEPLDDGIQLEEEKIEYGPHLPGAAYQAQNKQDCFDIVPFLPDISKPSSEVKYQTALGFPDEISAGDRENTSSTSATNVGAIAPAEEDGALDGFPGLFNEENSFSRNDTASGYKCETDANRFSSFDSVGTMMPSFSSDVGQISGGRAISAGGVRELETYHIMSLEGCLQAFTKTEVLSGENAWGCENCTRISHALREPEQSDETVDTKQLPEFDGESEPTSVGNSALNAIPDAERDGVQGEWQSLCLEDHVEDLSTSTNSLSIVVASQARDVPVETSSNGNSMIESATSEMVDDEQNSGERSAGCAGASLVELSPVEDASVSKSHNTLKRSQSQDCFNEPAALKAAESEPSSFLKEKQDVEEPYVLVEASAEDDAASQNGRRRRNNVARSAKETKERTTKLPSKGLQDGAMKLKKQAPKKMVTVKREATKTLLISKAPLVLTVHLKRFAQDMHGRLSKLSGRITFDEQLDLGPFIDQRGVVNRGSVYQLIGTVEHSGTMRGGHYVAYVKGFDNNNNSGETDAENSSGGGSTWYYISDSHVRKTSLESVLQSEAYLLFYERQTF